MGRFGGLKSCNHAKSFGAFLKIVMGNRWVLFLVMGRVSDGSYEISMLQGAD